VGQFASILATEGENITWHQREEHEISQDTGDMEVGEVFEPTIIKAIVQPIRADQIIIEAGYSVEDYIRIYTDQAIQQKDKITWQGNDYEVLPPQTFKFRGAVEYYTAICRRLIA